MELLVRVVDQVSRDPLKHALLAKAGDVIAWHPIGGAWGAAERDNPDWRIVRVPGLSEDEAEALVAGELSGPHAHEQLLRTRGMTLDVASLGIPAGRSPSGIDATVPVGRFRAAVGLKAPIPHPDRIGPATPHAIGD